MKLYELNIFVPDEEDTFGIPRKRMPQIKEEDYPEFFEYLKTHNVSFKKTSMLASDLKPIQKDFSKDGVVKALLKQKNKKPIIASLDNYIIDGHHRWLGAVNTRSNVNVLKTNSPVHILVDLVKKFPKTYYKDIYVDKPKETDHPMESISTTAGAVASVVNSRRPLKKKKKGIAPNALDTNVNLFTGNQIKRNM